MGWFEECVKYRLEMLRRLENENGNTPPPEVLEAQRVIANYRQKQADRDETAVRALLPIRMTLIPSTLREGRNETAA